MKFADYLYKTTCTVKYSPDEFEELFKILDAVLQQFMELEVPPKDKGLRLNLMLHLQNLHQLVKRLRNNGNIPRQITYSHAEAFTVLMTLESVDVQKAITGHPYNEILVSRTIEELYKHYTNPGAKISTKKIIVTSFIK